MQTQSYNRSYHKAQGQTQPSWRQTRVWNDVLRHVRPGGDMVCNLPDIVCGILFDWSLWQVDFVMAYPQAPIEMDMYMEIPQVIHLKNGNSKDHVLKLLANLYGQKQAGCVWNSYLVDKLLEIEFKQSLIDDCVFYCGDVIFIVYVDDGIFLGSSEEQLTNIITKLWNLDIDIEDQGHPADYVGVNIKKLWDGSLLG